MDETNQSADELIEEIARATIREIDNAQQEYDESLLALTGFVSLEAGVKQRITEISVPVIGSVTPEGEAMLDRIYWDAWERHAVTAIDAGEVIPACARVLEMLRLCIGVQVSAYGAEVVERVVDAFYVKYGVRADGQT